MVEGQADGERLAAGRGEAVVLGPMHRLEAKRSGRDWSGQGEDKDRSVGILRDADRGGKAGAGGRLQRGREAPGVRARVISAVS